MILTEKQQKYQHHHPEKFIAFEKQTKKIEEQEKNKLTL